MLGVLRRCPGGLWDHLYPIQLGFDGKHMFGKIGQVFLYAYVEMGGSAPCCQACLWRPNGPHWTNSHAVWQSPSSRDKKLRTFSKKSIFLYFSTFLFRPTGVLCAVCALVVIFRGWHTILRSRNAAWVSAKTLSHCVIDPSFVALA